MPKLRLTVLMGLTLVQVAVGSLIATLALSDVAAAASPTASRTIQVGPGFTDVSPHQLVRTSANVLYTLAATCDNYPDCPANTLRVYRADQPGTPTSFSEQDVAHRPAAVGSVAIALDASDTIHALWNDRIGNVNYATFSTATNTWNPATVLAATNWNDFGQGDEGVALAIDSSGTPHAVWSAKTPDGALHLFYANRAASWTPQQIDDVPLTGNRRTMHPTLAFRPDGVLLLAWLEGTFNYVPDGAIHSRARSSAGAWGTTQTIADPDGVMTTIDNGPSLIVTPDGTAHIAFVAANPPDQIRYWYDPGTGWRGDQQPPAQITHDPSLGPDGNGSVFIYGHGTPVPTYQDHGDNLYSFHKPSSGAWGAWTLYATGSFDSSVSTRWAQFFHPFPATLDIAFWADPYPNVLFVGSDSAASTGGTASAITANTGTTPQSAAVLTPFATPLAVTVTDALANPVAGASVVFAAPASGASGTFTGGVTTATVSTGANGLATAPAFTANSTPGSYTVTASVAGVATPASFSITNNAAPVSALLVAGFPSTTAGTAQSFTVTAQDANGNTVVGYTGIVHFTSSDPQATPLSDYTFTAADNGTHTFSATLKTSGIQSITAADTVTSGVTGTQTGITVSPATASSLALSGFPSPSAAGVAGNIVVTAKDVFGNIATAYTGTVHFASSDSAAIVPVNYTFTSGAGSGFDNGVHSSSLTFNTAGLQSITATDTATTTITGSQSNISVTAPLLTSISITPASPIIVTGATQQFTATGHYANSTTQDLTTSATWSSSNTGVATISNASGNQGLSVAKSVGTTPITAASGGVTSAPTTLTVTQANTTTTLLSSKNPATDADPVTFTASVAAVLPGTGTPSGTIIFKDGTTALGSPITLTSGQATFVTSALSLGGHTITATYSSDTNFAGSASASLGQQVTAAAAARLVVAGFAAPVSAGTAQPFTVTAQDTSGNTAAGYIGTIHFTSSDPQAALPTDYTFTAADNGVHSFTASLKVAGIESITAADTAVHTISGSQGAISVTAAAPAAVNASAGTPQSTGVGKAFATPLTVTVADAFANPVGGAIVTFAAPASGASGTFAGGIATGTTNASGIAIAATFTANGTPGGFSVTASVAGVATPASFSLTNTPGTASRFAIGAAANGTAGVTFNVTVTAQDTNGNTVTGYTGTVHLTSSDPQAALPSDYTFTGADAGVHTFAATLRTAGAQTITVTDTASAVTPGSASVGVGSATTAQFEIAGFPPSVTTGTPGSFSVTAKDAFGNTAVGYTGTIHFTSSDTQATLPVDSGLTGGIGTFSATLKTAGTQSITARDTATSSITGSVTSSVTVTTSSSTLLVGNNTVESSADSNPGGTAEAFQYIASASGTVDRLFVYIDGANTAAQVKLGLYSNGANNTVGLLLTQAAITNPIKGAWNSISVPPVGVTRNRVYWLALLGPTETGTVQFRDKPTAGNSQVSKQTNLTALPSAWIPGATFPTNAMSAYAAQTGGATSDTSPPIILGVMAMSVQSTSATLTWATDEAATTQVEYGTSNTYGRSTAVDPALVTYHSQTIGGLTANTTYHYRVHSSDATGLASVSDDNVFTTPPPPPTSLVGDGMIEGNLDNNPAGLAEAFQFTASASGTMNQLSVYIDGSNTATQVIVGLYTNTAGNAPGTLLAQATIANPTKGAWNTASVLPTSVTGGTSYWIAVLGPTGAGTVEFRDAGTGKRSQTSARSDLGSLPSTWAAGTTYGSGPLSAYASGATPTPLPASRPGGSGPLTGATTPGAPNPLPPPR